MLFAVRKGTRWWDGYGKDRRGRYRDHWETSIGCACLFTRRAVANRVAARAGGTVMVLRPMEAR